MRGLSTRLLALSFVALLGFSAPGCGGNKKKKNPFGPTETKRKKKRRTVVKRKPRVQVSPNWKRVRPHFKRFLSAIENMEMDRIRDPFEEQRNHWIPESLRMVKKKIKKIEPVKKKKVDRTNRPPLERYSVKQYKLKAILSATDIPKALLVDPEGNGFIVWKNRTVGAEKGQIMAITQYEVVIKIPGKDPVKISIAPRFDMFKTIQ